MIKKFSMTPTEVEYEEQLIDKNRYIPPTTNNEIYFYTPVTPESSYILNKNLSDLQKQLLILQINYGLSTTPNINLYINSDGGEIFGALSVVYRIKSSKVPIHSYIEGNTASAATLISVCCHQRYMRKNSIMLVHQLRTWFEGTYTSLKDENKNMDLLTDAIKNFYLTHTKFTDVELTEILQRDMYLNAHECLRFGLIDYII